MCVDNLESYVPSRFKVHYVAMVSDDLVMNDVRDSGIESHMSMVD